MPPFIALAIAGVGIYAGFKWVTREWQRAASEHGVDAAGADARHVPKDLGTLEWDASTGVYKPRKESAG